MKFNEIYQHSIFLDAHEFEGSFIIKGNKLAPCWHCKELTFWVDGNFQAYLCSEECQRAKWEEFIKAHSGVKSH